MMNNMNESQSIYQLDELMTQTRKLAAQYRLKTGQILPISNELAKYDVQYILSLKLPMGQLNLKSVDCIDPEKNIAFQVKSRVVFKANAPQRVGQLNISGDWDQTLLVIYDDSYQPNEIYALEKSVLLNLEHSQPKHNPNKNKRGALSVGKFKVLSKLIWSSVDGLIG